MGAGGEARDDVKLTRPSRALPSAMDALSDLVADAIRDRRRIVFFLDYDGTLSPIVEDPDTAYIPDRTREALALVAERFTTAIVSGRSKQKIMSMVNMQQLIYAGSHGFDIEGPNGSISHRVATEWLPSLNNAKEKLQKLVPAFPGSSVEDNWLSVSFHYRKCAPTRIPDAQARVDELAKELGLVRTKGKMVYELRPVFDWHKGKAVEYLLDTLNMGPDVLPIYIGDDVTDEDAFKVLRGRGISVIVADSSVPRDTHADMRLDDPYEVQRFLMHFAKDESLTPLTVRE